MFSLLISVYKNENPEFLASALNSIVNQSLQPSEIILVKDGLLGFYLDEVIDDFKHKTQIPIILIQLNNNLGLGLALRRGLLECNFEIVARMDSDDISHESRFELQYNFLKNNPEIVVVGTQIEEFIDIPGDLRTQRSVPLTPEHVYYFSKYRNPLNHMTVMFRKQPVMIVGSYEHMPFFEDYFLWVKLIKNGYKIANLDKVLLFMRVGNHMIGRRQGLRYIRSEIDFFLKLYHIKHITFIHLLLYLFLRIPLRALPASFLKIIYKYFLR